MIEYRNLRVALLGAGSVGAQVADQLLTHRDELAARIGAGIELVGVAVRDVDAPRDTTIPRELLTTDAESLILGSDIVVELMGGLEPARTLILQALNSGADVITANKALLATHGPELFEAAEQVGAQLYYEAAVGGAIPIIRPLRDAPVLAVVTVLIGLYMAFHAMAGWIFGYPIQIFPSPFPQGLAIGRLMSAHEVGSILVTCVLVGALFAFFRFTPVGLAMRGAADNPVSARLLGHNVGLLVLLGWGLAGAIGSVAGMMVAPVVFLDPAMMSGVLIYAFAGALIGGIDSPIGAVIGGFLVGILENLAGAYLVGSELKFAFALVLIVAVLIVRPAGLMGRKLVTRV